MWSNFSSTNYTDFCTNMSANTLENAIIPHTFRFVCTYRSAQIKSQGDPHFTQTKILVYAYVLISPHTSSYVCTDLVCPDRSVCVWLPLVGHGLLCRELDLGYYEWERLRTADCERNQFRVSGFNLLSSWPWCAPKTDKKLREGSCLPVTGGHGTSPTLLTATVNLTRSCVDLVFPAVRGRRRGGS